MDRPRLSLPTLVHAVLVGSLLALLAPRALWAQEPLRAMPLSEAAVWDDPAAGPVAGVLTVPAGESGDLGAASLGSDVELLPAPRSSLAAEEPWRWQVAPGGLMYPSYLAGPKEPRLASQMFHTGEGDFWDLALGGRAGVLRYGTPDALWPEGWQLDVEGAAFPRLTLDEDRDLVSADFRGGFPLTYRRGVWESKFGYYHLSSHLGDEFLLKHPEVTRINFSRDCLIFGLAWRPVRAWRFYGETAWAFYSDGGSDPWEIQFGLSYAPDAVTGLRGAPFAAVNGHLRQEVRFGGNLTVQAGWAWRGATGHLTRVGLHYLNGLSDQFQFFDRFEQQLGAGFWYDF